MERICSEGSRDSDVSPFSRRCRFAVHMEVLRAVDSWSLEFRREVQAGDTASGSPSEAG